MIIFSLIYAIYHDREYSKFVFALFGRFRVIAGSVVFSLSNYIWQNAEWRGFLRFVGKPDVFFIKLNFEKLCLCVYALPTYVCAFACKVYAGSLFRTTYSNIIYYAYYIGLQWQTHSYELI